MYVYLRASDVVGTCRRDGQAASPGVGRDDYSSAGKAVGQQSLGQGQGERARKSDTDSDNGNDSTTDWRGLPGNERPSGLAGGPCRFSCRGR